MAIGAPKPVGAKLIVWRSTVFHLPGTSGARVGISPPSTFFTGFEKTMVSGVEGETSEPAGGVAATAAEPLAGNQVTVSNSPSCSHLRAAAATRTLPAAGCSPMPTERCGCWKRRWTSSPSGP